MNDNGLERYLGGFRGDTVEEMTLSQYEGRVYRISYALWQHLSARPGYWPAQGERYKVTAIDHDDNSLCYIKFLDDWGATGHVPLVLVK